MCKSKKWQARHIKAIRLQMGHWTTYTVSTNFIWFDLKKISFVMLQNFYQNKKQNKFSTWSACGENFPAVF